MSPSMSSGPSVSAPVSTARCRTLAFCLSQDAELPARFDRIDADRLQTRHGIGLVAIPTTAGTGAEVTSNAVLSLEDIREKVSLRGRALFPDAALVDPLLLPSAPQSVVLHAGLDAVVQTIEAYTSRFATPFSDALTSPNIAVGLDALRRVVEDPDDAAWEHIAWVSLSSGLALANSGLGAAHGLAAILGAALGAPHGALCGRLIAPVLRHNRRIAGTGAATDAAARIDTCIAAIAEHYPSPAGSDQLAGFEAWIDRHGLPFLSDHGAEPGTFRLLAERGLGASSTQKNAVAIQLPDLEAILREAC
jgi:alcohol dehydrogenase class IV